MEHNLYPSKDSKIFKYGESYFNEIVEDKKILLYYIKSHFDLDKKFINTKKIIKLLNIYLKKYDERFDVYYYLGMIKEFEGKYQEALVFYEKSSNLNKKFINSKFRIWYLARTRKIKLNANNYLLSSDNSMKIVKINYKNFKKSKSFKYFRTQQETLIKIENVFDSKIFHKSKFKITSFLKNYNYKKNFIASFHDAPRSIKFFIYENLINNYLYSILNKLSNNIKKGWVPLENSSWWIQYMELKLNNKLRPFGISTPPHQDNPIYSSNSEWYTFWIPLDKVGKGIAPTISVLNHDGVLFPIDTANEIKNRINSINKKFVFEYFKNNMTNVSANVGDIIIFGRNMLHWTFISNDMKKNRTSLDLRWSIGTNYDL